jgi:pimeloyl-ACP methyl ester carboxylesterase
MPALIRPWYRLLLVALLITGGVSYSGENLDSRFGKASPTENVAAPVHAAVEDVPAEVIVADDAIAAETAASIGLDSISTGIIVEDAAKIDVPIYLCLGERDVSPDPHAEPSYFKRSSDFTLHILPRSAHCQNFASTRHQMWNRMHVWARSVSV